MFDGYSCIHSLESGSTLGEQAGCEHIDMPQIFNMEGSRGMTRALHYLITK